MIDPASIQLNAFRSRADLGTGIRGSKYFDCVTSGGGAVLSSIFSFSSRWLICMWQYKKWSTHSHQNRQCTNVATYAVQSTDLGSGDGLTDGKVAMYINGSARAIE
jgi:hypothetical protein